MYFTIVKACETHGCKTFRPNGPERKPSNNFDKRESVPQTPWIWSRTFLFQMPSFMSIFRGAGVHASQTLRFYLDSDYLNIRKLAYLHQPTWAQTTNIINGCFSKTFFHTEILTSSVILSRFLLALSFFSTEPSDCFLALLFVAIPSSLFFG